MKSVEIVLLGAILLNLASCQNKPNALFQLIPPEESGVTFSNRITESDTLNILNEEYIYNGGGVGVGDFNNDGLSDLYFTGNQVDNVLYLNQGAMRFADVTDEAQVAGNGQWCSGVALVDINQDGWLDIYVSSTLSKDSLRRKNLLYVNQGLNENNVPTFTEEAANYGIADTGNTTQAAFFDYDRDGDLDLYLLTNVINAKVPTNYRPKLEDGSAVNTDRLYRNDLSPSDALSPPGGGQGGGFTNVTREAGILIEGFGLGITVTDINLDGLAGYLHYQRLHHQRPALHQQPRRYLHQPGSRLSQAPKLLGDGLRCGRYQQRRAVRHHRPGYAARVEPAAKADAGCKPLRYLPQQRSV